MVGDGARALVARAFGVAHDDPLATAALATYNALYLAAPAVYTELLPGACELLAAAEAASLPCAIVTNKPRDMTMAVLEALGIASNFTAIWGGGDGTLKPAPDGVLGVISRLGVAAERSWMIGDGPQDVLAGRAAGCFTIGVPGIAERDSLVASAPDLLVDSLHDVRAILRATADRGGPRPL
jgi:phosphoglycolate phosphatase